MTPSWWSRSALSGFQSTSRALRIDSSNGLPEEGLELVGVGAPWVVQIDLVMVPVFGQTHVGEVFGSPWPSTASTVRGGTLMRAHWAVPR